MKRNPHLIPLSKEHHFGLLFCWKLKQGVQKQAQPDVMRSYVQHFWQRQLQEHFALEDKALGRLLEPHHEMQQRLKEEHQLLGRRIADVMSGTKSKPADFLELADLLTRHIRFEERELFPYLEETLTAGQMEGIGRQLSAQELIDDDSFTPAFWAREYEPEMKIV